MQQQRAVATRDALLEAGELLLDGRDPDAISLEEILTRAGASASSFYQRFGSKDRFIDLLHGRFCERMQADALDVARAEKWTDRTLEGAAEGGVIAYLRIRRGQATALESLAIVERRRPLLAARRRRASVAILEAIRRTVASLRSRDGRFVVPERLDLGLDMAGAALRSAIEGRTRILVVTPEEELRLAQQIAAMVIAFLLDDGSPRRSP